MFLQFLSVLLFSIDIWFANGADSSMNLACGTIGSYRNPSGNKWFGDAGFATNVGRSGKVSSEHTVSPPLNTLRSFPGYEKVCYSFKMVPVGTMVSVTTQFYYGNYDGELSPPTFGVQYDNNDMHSVAPALSNVVLYTLSYATPYERIYVCLTSALPDDIPAFLNTLQISGPGVDPDNINPQVGNDTRPNSPSPPSPPTSFLDIDFGSTKSKIKTVIIIVVCVVVGLPVLVCLGVLLCCLVSCLRRRRTIYVPQVQIAPGPPDRNRNLQGREQTKSQCQNLTDPAARNWTLDSDCSQGGTSKSYISSAVVLVQGSEHGKSTPLVQINHVFSYSQIIEITNNFKRRIGKGGSGVVYYGRLRDGREVAVKVLNESLPQGEKEFVSEVQLLLTVHHKCIAGFVGYCEEGQSLILIYEYMKGGNLRQLLSDASSKSAILTWDKRLQMAQSIATGLDYLHSGCQRPIIHRDVKTTNVLLNDKMEAKIADFGLSKAGVEEDMTFVATVVAGTPGYIDPRYSKTNRLTTKSDVYSFGVVLLELISGHSPIMSATDGKRYSLVEWAAPRIEGNEAESVADPILRGQYDAESMWRVSQVALACVSESPEQRPTMADVVSEIKVAIEMQTRHGATTVDGATGGFRASSPSGFADLHLASPYSNADQYADNSYKRSAPPPMGR